MITPDLVAGWLGDLDSSSGAGVMGIAEMSSSSPDEVVKLGPPGSPEMVMIMNETQHWNGHIERIY